MYAIFSLCENVIEEELVNNWLTCLPSPLDACLQFEHLI